MCAIRTSRKYSEFSSDFSTEFHIWFAHFSIGVRLGEHNIATNPDCQRSRKISYCAPPVEDVGIANILPHPDFNGRTLSNDVAIITLDRAVEFQSTCHLFMFNCFVANFKLFIHSYSPHFAHLFAHLSGSTTECASRFDGSRLGLH